MIMKRSRRLYFTDSLVGVEEADIHTKSVQKCQDSSFSDRVRRLRAFSRCFACSPTGFRALRPLFCLIP